MGCLSSKPVKVLLAGLDSSGSTTLLFKLKQGEVVATIPTKGVNVEIVSWGSKRFEMWDVGGHSPTLWHSYYPGVRVVIFVVDAVDRERFADAKQRLHELGVNDELKDAIFLVLAHKQDAEEAASADVLNEELEMKQFPKKKRWYVQASSAITGAGIPEGMDWIISTLTNNNK